MRMIKTLCLFLNISYLKFKTLYTGNIFLLSPNLQLENLLLDPSPTFRAFLKLFISDQEINQKKKINLVVCQ